MGDQKDKTKDNKQISVQKAIAEVAATPSGRVLFAYLKDSCFFETSTITGDPRSHEVNPLGTVFNESRRRLYLDIRRAIPVHLRRRIENPTQGDKK